MARYKPYDYSQSKLIPVSFAAQILPGSFEHTLSYLVEHEVDLSVFESRYVNDETGRPAYDPSILLKIVLYAYSRGITSSREIERCCRENVMFMALSADTQPHFTTIAKFVSEMGEAATSVFRDILLVCDEQGLIGREMFAVDGVKLPSNASKEWSGTKAEFAKKVKKMEGAVRYLVRRHREEDERSGRRGGPGGPDERREREERQIETLRSRMKKLRTWMAENEDKPGKTGKPRKSNVTDNESAKMMTSHGVIQGYVGAAVVDAKHQVVVYPEAFGEAQEHELLVPLLEGTREQFRSMGRDEDVLRRASVVVDSGYHTEDNVEYVYERGIDGYVADTRFRQRDPRFGTAKRHKESKRPKTEKRFTPAEFRYDAGAGTCICPAGQKLYRNGTHCMIGGREAVKFHGAMSVCGPCELRAQCLRHPERTPARQVAFFTGLTKKPKRGYSERMRRKIDSPEGRDRYGKRLGIVEPVFGHIRDALGLNRFSLRGKRKVNVQWLLYCLVHNIGKVHRFEAVPA